MTTKKNHRPTLVKPVTTREKKEVESGPIRGETIEAVIVDEATDLSSLDVADVQRVEQHVLRADPTGVQDSAPAIQAAIDAEAERTRRAMTRAAIVSNGAVRQVCQIMMNGTRMSTHQHINFSAHEGLLRKLLGAYELRDRKAAEEQFLATLSDYLEQATRYLPQSGHKEDVPILIGLITLLIHEHEEDDGFGQVARHILSSAHAPVDRF